MPYKEPKIEKYYYSIKEVSELFDVNPSLIRFWEDKFPTLKPFRNNKGNRLYTKEDIEKIRLIYHLVKERGMTLSGAKKKMRENKEGTNNNFEVVKLLNIIRSQLVEIRNELGEE